MDLALLVYSIGIISSVLHLLGGVIVCCIVLLFCLGMFYATECKQESWNGQKENEKRQELAEKTKPWIKKASITLVVSALIVTFLPSQKTAYMMIGAYSAQKVAENPRMQEVAAKIMKIIDVKMDEYVDEVISDAEKKVGKK